MMLIKLALIDAQPPNLQNLAKMLKSLNGFMLEPAIGGNAVENFRDSLADPAMALESIVIHIFAYGDNASILLASILLKASFLPFGNNAAVLTMSLQQAYDYVILNTIEPNPGKLVNELYSIIKPLGVFDEISEVKMSSGLKLTVGG